VTPQPPTLAFLEGNSCNPCLLSGRKFVHERGRGFRRHAKRIDELARDTTGERRVMSGAEATFYVPREECVGDFFHALVSRKRSIISPSACHFSLASERVL